MIHNLKKINKNKHSKNNNNILIESKFIERVIRINRVSKVTKGGRKLSFQVIIVVGNKNGQVGIGVAKANNVLNAFKKAKVKGYKNLIKVSITKTLSIPYMINGKFNACKIIMKPSIEGSGIISGGASRIILETAGIKNIVTKQIGSNNLLNNSYATILALKNLSTKSYIIQKRKLNSNGEN